MMACLVCRADAVKMFLDLGETALANRFLTDEDLGRPEPAYPLRVGFCVECGHVQLMEHVPPPAMFEEYLYISSMSDTLKAHLHDLARVVVERYRLGPHDLVVDVGSNDGTLLGGFRSLGVRTLGVDPARNLADLARRNGIETETAFFGAETAARIAAEWGGAAVVTSTNTFPHIPDLADFVRGLDVLLRPGGVFVIEVHYLRDLLDQSAFDTIYHEHVSYWSLGPMVRLFQAHGMEVVDVERLPLHHGQLRAFVHRAGEGEVRPSVPALLEDERAAGLDRFETYERFAARTERIKRDLRATLEGLRAEGKRVAGYGAPAKASTLLGFLGLGPADVEYIADRSPLKQGRYTPGTHVPIVPPSRLLEDRPDYVLLLAWNFADEIMAQQAEYLRGGGRFILPVPVVRIR